MARNYSYRNNKCYGCDKHGHFARDCPNREDGPAMAKRASSNGCAKEEDDVASQSRAIGHHDDSRGSGMQEPAGD
jgi:hypothetical protein